MGAIVIVDLPALAAQTLAQVSDDMPDAAHLLCAARIGLAVRRLVDRQATLR